MMFISESGMKCVIGVTPITWSALLFRICRTIVEQRGLQREILNKLDVRHCMSGVTKEGIPYHEIT